jgi:Ribonuclease HI
MAFDGALNSQGAGAGFILTSPSGEQFKHAIHLNFRAINNTAEYEGFFTGIRAAAALGVKQLVVKGDSELVANQVHKDYKCSSPELSKYLAEVRKLEKRFDGIEVRHVYRKDNIEPDDIARRASRREPLEPGTFLDVLMRPSVKEATGEDSPVPPTSARGLQRQSAPLPISRPQTTGAPTHQIHRQRRVARGRRRSRENIP